MAITKGSAIVDKPTEFTDPFGKTRSAYSKLNEFARMRRDDPSNSSHVTDYWVGYLDGLKALARELPTI